MKPQNNLDSDNSLSNLSFSSESTDDTSSDQICPGTTLTFYKKSKPFYSLILSDTNYNLTGPNSLATELNTEVSNILHSFTNAKKISKNSKITIMQYKICHRIISCNEYLCRTKIRPDNHCNFCDSRDTVEHFFATCPSTKTLWLDIQNWYNGTMKYAITFSPKLIVLGSNPKNPSLANTILHGKWFVYKSKMSKSVINLNNFLKEFKSQANIEKMGTLLNKSDNAIHKHNAIWEHLFPDAKISL